MSTASPYVITPAPQAAIKIHPATDGRLMMFHFIECEIPSCWAP